MTTHSGSPSPIRRAALACVAVVLTLVSVHTTDPARARSTFESITLAGTPGQADLHSVVQMSQLALQESSAPAIEEEPTAVHSPLPRFPLPEAPAGAAAAPVLPAPLPELLPGPSLASLDASFLALDDNNTTIPPDTHGAAGPNHLMVTLNSQVRIQNRTGTALSTVTLRNFWASVGNPSTFDPKVLYDPYGNRWIFTCMANSRSATSAVLIGVSQTNDPTGTWNLYSVDADSGNTLWADFPSIGFNKNWIVVQVNMFTNSANSFSRSQVYVFNKSNLYSGGAGLFTKVNDSTGGFTTVAAQTYDSTLDTMYLLEDWNGNFSGSGYLRLSTITGSVGAETFTTGVSFPSTPNPWDFGTSSDFAPQLGSAQKIQTNDSRMGNVVYRNGSLWATHTVFLPASGQNRSAVQVWEINPTTGATTQRIIIDDSSAQVFRAFPSVAVNKNNDVLVGYSRFSSSTHASAYYAVRMSTDALNTIGSEQLLKAGEAPYFKTFSGTKNRWGDYSATMVDPVNDTDWWTIQEYPAPASGGSDRWGTWWGKISPGGTTSSNPSWRITLTKTTYANGETLSLTEFGPRNTSSSAVTCRMRVWIAVPTVGDVTLIDVGSDGTFSIPANIDVNAAPLSFFTISDSFPPKGSWSFNSKVTNPTTGATLSEDLNPFTVQ